MLACDIIIQQHIDVHIMRLPSMLSADSNVNLCLYCSTL